MNKILLTLAFVLALCGNAFSATCSAVSVMPSGGDYAKLSDAVAYLQANCATLSAPSVITISGTWSSPDTTAVTISGITTSSTNTITVTTSGTARHDGTAYKSGAYTISAVITVASSFTIINGITSSGGVNNSAISGLTYTVKNCVFNAAIIQGCSNYNFKVYIYNNVFMNVTSAPWPTGPYYPTGAAILPQLNPVEYVIYNNTFFGCNTAIGGSGAGGTVILKNNLVYSTVLRKSGDYTVSGISNTSTNNVASDATAPAYNTYYNNKTPSFVNTSAGSEDLHLASNDNVAINLGASLSSDSYLPFSYDIDGDSRPQGSSWDIGADEYVASGGGSTWGTCFANFTGKNFIYPGK